MADGWEARQVTGTDLRILGRRFRQASNGAVVRKALTAGIQSELKPTVQAVKEAVLALEFSNSKGGGTKRRRLHYAELHPRGRVKAHGLRATIARAAKSRVSYSGRSVGAKIYMDKSVLPPDMQSLPRYMDSEKGWRHPFFGNEPWTTQKGKPYFVVTIRPRMPRMRQAVVVHIGQALKELQR
jgi:hypothetical protein